ncbi:MAG: 4-hydroxy-tetrahydrodipicolinate reductase [Gammaproteobacteria bacterium]|nr:4-hydroxy-tetrahydrodipicolinate reductase [Gammaproteobacteria bacterium]
MSLPAGHGVAIFGITGRMGQSLVRCLTEEGAARAEAKSAAGAEAEGRGGGANAARRNQVRQAPGSERQGGADPVDPGEFALRLSGAAAGAGSSRLGQDAAAEGRPSGVLITADLDLALRDAGVAVDFSRPEFVVPHAEACVRAGVPLLVGTTGFDAQARAAVEAASRQIAVLIAPNTSVGVGVMAQLVRMATSSLGPEFDVEIVEAHHRLKRDAPSGTALALGQVVADARAQALADVAVFDRHGVFEPRKAGSIGFSAVRAGDIVGEHTVIFAGSGERVEITHRATDRATFARGALRAAKWLVGRRPGLYGMENVLDLR